MDQSGASEYSCVYALTDLDRNECIYGTVGSLGDAFGEFKSGGHMGLAYALPDDEAAKRLMMNYAFNSIMADLAAWELCKQFGWSKEMYEEILETCAHRLSQGVQNSDDI